MHVASSYSQSPISRVLSSGLSSPTSSSSESNTSTISLLLIAFFQLHRHRCRQLLCQYHSRQKFVNCQSLHISSHIQWSRASCGAFARAGILMMILLHYEMLLVSARIGQAWDVAGVFSATHHWLSTRHVYLITRHYTPYSIQYPAGHLSVKMGVRSVLSVLVTTGPTLYIPISGPYVVYRIIRAPSRDGAFSLKYVIIRSTPPPSGSGALSS